MAMDKEKLISGIVGGIVAGFSIGVGFLIAQRTMGNLISKKKADNDTKVSDAVKEGVKEGVKQAKIEEDAANFAAMNANPRSRGRHAMNKMMMNRPSNFMGFDGGNPDEMNFVSDPRRFKGSPNSILNNF